MQDGGRDLRAYFERGEHRLIHKWMHFFEIYDRHFARFRGTDVRLLEFGVYHGGSLQMWRHYLGERAEVFGADIDPRCLEVQGPGIEVLIGDQEDRGFLASLKQRLPKVDIIIDDGGHTMTQQITTFTELFPHLADGGVYLAEDLHTSYLPAYGGGAWKAGTFIEFSKQLIDQLNAWHSAELTVDEFTRSAHSMHYYDSVLVIEKRKITAPHARMRGVPSFPLNDNEKAVLAKG